MEDFHDNLLSKLSSAALSKKTSFNGNGVDDLFGGPPKFAVPSFAALIDDYSEMFGSFHALKSSPSVPILDFQVVDCDDVSVDVLSSNFSYSEVFGGFDGEDFAVYYEETFEENLSENPRSQAEMGSQQQALTVISRAPSEELDGDAFVCPEKNNILSNVTSYDIYDGTKQSDVSLNKENEKTRQHSIHGPAHTAQSREVSGSNFVVDTCSSLQKVKYDKPLPQVTDGLRLNLDSNGGITIGKYFETFSNAPVCSSSTRNSGNDVKADQEQLGCKWNTLEDTPPNDQCHLHHSYNHLASYVYRSYSGGGFLTVSDINLQTHPSPVPPPSRPPPKLVNKQGDTERMINVDKKGYPGEVHLCKPSTTDRACHIGMASETYTLEEAAKDSSPPFFDVEIDSGSAAVVSAAAMGEAMEKAQARLKSAKESMERKRDNFESHMKLGLNEQRKGKEKREGTTAQENHKFKEEVAQETCEREICKMKDFVGDERLTAIRAACATPDSEAKWGYIELAKESIVKRQVKEYQPTLQCCKQEERAGELKTEKQFHELVRNEKLKLVQDIPELEQKQKWRATVKLHMQELNEKKAAAAEARKLEKNERSSMIQDTCGWEENNMEMKEALKQDVNVNRSETAPEVCEREQNERKLGVAYEHGEKNFEAAKEVHGHEENDKKLKADREANEMQGKEKKLKAAQMVLNRADLNRTTSLDYEKKLKAAVQHEEEVIKLKTAEETCEFEVNEKELKAAKEACKHDENERRIETAQDTHEEEDNEEIKSTKDANDCQVNEKKMKAAEDASDCEENEKETKVAKEANKCNKDEKKLKSAKMTRVQYQNEETLKKAQDVCWWDEKEKKLKAAHDAHGCKKDEERVYEEVLLQDGSDEKFEVAQEAHWWEDNANKLKARQVSSEWVKMEKLKTAKEAHDVVCNEKNIRQDPVFLERLSNKNKFKAAQEVFRWLESGKKSEAAANIMERRENMLRTTSKVKLCQGTESKVEYGCGIREMEEREKEESMPKERELEKGWVRKMEEEREWEQEREKDRIAVERANHEACDVASAEARERVERVPMERVTVEAQQRAMVDAQASGEMASAEAREKSLAQKASTEARVRAECAALERATAETWDQVADRDLVEKATSKASGLMKRSNAEKFTAREDDGIERFVELNDDADFGSRQCPSSSDMQDFAHDPELQSASFSSKYSNSANHGPSYSDQKFQGADGESAKRCKARLERHQRMLERVAKALAEKNLRDILAQRELAERNRLAEALDADVRRWSNGKEGNLRALLSTLQYILRPESGWQPIPLTDVITAVAVKKAYKKAALYVHPDKVQQRRANIQQKYICEKVFDLLKEAWNIFNSEER
ncbi:auxilin-related protein 2-like [Magnolia sinica]|uniref:auxilin-related protein 2-like n=1 Tax=Magnolia sinica TaxID=86752 RepID=UPI002658A5C5|nr:auxilin-related protein 2-like [Magnolia sinica]